MTQPLLIAMPDSDIAPVTEGAAIEALAINSELAGDAVEFELCKQLSLRGWNARHMGGKHPGYDVIATKPEYRGMFVQAKTAFAYEDAYMIKNKSGEKIYGANAYDVLAAYLPDVNGWAFFLRKEIGNRQGFRYARQKRCMRADAIPYRAPNNWHLLDEVAESLTAHQKSFTP